MHIQTSMLLDSILIATNPATRNRVMRHGMWNLADVPVVMSVWTPFITESPPEVSSVPLWVHLKHVTMDMFSWKGLSYITSAVGDPDRLHPETAQCVDLKTAKVFIKADLTQELPKSMNFNYQGKDTTVDFIYPWLPSRCSICRKWGHTTKVCVANGNDVPKDTKQELIHNAATVKDGDKIRNSDTMQDVLPKSPEIILPKQNRNVPSGNDDAEARTETKNAEKKKESKDDEWSIVSLSKSSRSPNGSKNLKYGEVSLLTSSRFSALEQDEDTSTPDSTELTTENQAREQPLETNLEEKTQNQLLQTEQVEQMGNRAEASIKGPSTITIISKQTLDDLR